MWVRSHEEGGLVAEPPAAGGQLGSGGGTFRAWRLFTNIFSKKIRNFKHILIHIFAWNHHLKYCKVCSSIPLAFSREAKHVFLTASLFLFRISIAKKKIPTLLDYWFISHQYLNYYINMQQRARYFILVSWTKQ